MCNEITSRLHEGLSGRKKKGAQNLNLGCGVAIGGSGVHVFKGRQRYAEGVSPKRARKKGEKNLNFAGGVAMGEACVHCIRNNV